MVADVNVRSVISAVQLLFGQPACRGLFRRIRRHVEGDVAILGGVEKTWVKLCKSGRRLTLSLGVFPAGARSYEERRVLVSR
jgi:hypothetical protein